jgi:hypothetical protein
MEDAVNQLQLQLQSNPFFNDSLRSIITKALQSNQINAFEFLITNHYLIKYIPGDSIYSQKEFIRILLDSCQNGEQVSKIILTYPFIVDYYYAHLENQEKSKLYLLSSEQFSSLIPAIYRLVQDPSSNIRYTDLLILCNSDEKIEKLILFFTSQTEEVYKTLSDIINHFLDQKNYQITEVIRKHVSAVIKRIDIAHISNFNYLLSLCSPKDLETILTNSPAHWKKVKLYRDYLNHFIDRLLETDQIHLLPYLLDSFNFEPFQIRDVLERLSQHNSLNQDVLNLLIKNKTYLLEVLCFINENKNLDIPKECVVHLSNEDLLFLFKNKPYVFEHIASFLKINDPDYITKILPIIENHEVMSDNHNHYTLEDILDYDKWNFIGKEPERKRYLQFILKNPVFKIPKLKCAVMILETDKYLISNYLNSRKKDKFIYTDDIEIFTHILQRNKIFAKTLFKYLKNWYDTQVILKSDYEMLHKHIFNSLPFWQRLFLW